MIQLKWFLNYEAKFKYLRIEYSFHWYISYCKKQLIITEWVWKRLHLFKRTSHKIIYIVQARAELNQYYKLKYKN